MCGGEIGVGPFAEGETLRIETLPFDRGSFKAHKKPELFATVQVGEAVRVTFAQAVIATGSSPSIPPLLRAAGDRLVVNDDVFDWDELPGAVAVFGPGVIGLELGQALHRLGVRVLVTLGARAADRRAL